MMGNGVLEYGSIGVLGFECINSTTPSLQSSLVRERRLDDPSTMLRAIG
jgi:hypothetical protein